MLHLNRKCICVDIGFGRECPRMDLLIQINVYYLPPYGLHPEFYFQASRTVLLFRQILFVSWCGHTDSRHSGPVQPFHPPNFIIPFTKIHTVSRPQSAVLT